MTHGRLEKKKSGYNKQYAVLKGALTLATVPKPGSTPKITCFHAAAAAKKKHNIFYF